MARFRHYDYNQTTMVVINYQDQFQSGTFEHALDYQISENLEIQNQPKVSPIKKSAIQNKQKRASCWRKSWLKTGFSTGSLGFTVIGEKVTSMNVLLLGKKGLIVEDVQNKIQMPHIKLFAGTSIEDVRAIFTQNEINHVIMGAGIELNKRLEIIKEIFELSEATTVHMKDFSSGPQGMIPFVKAILVGLQT